jgi:DNA gyrase subunit A
MHRASSGVRGIRLRPGDEVVSALLADDAAEALTVTERGVGKRVEFKDFPRKNRGGMGVRALKVTEKTGKLVSMMPVFELNDLLLISSDGTVIRISAASISILSRAAQGVRVMRLREGDSLVAVEVVECDDEDEVERTELPEDEGEFDNSETATDEAEEADEEEEGDGEEE